MAGVLYKRWQKKRGDTDSAVLLLDRVTWALEVAGMTEGEATTHVWACAAVNTVRTSRRPRTAREGDG